MPFGLKNSGATFQRMMNSILINVIDVKCFIDDVAMHSANQEIHIKHLESLIALLLKYEFRIRLKKCLFTKTRIELL